jgi:hypothetical protein
MKNIHFVGFILWLIASFFCFKLFTILYNWFDTGGMVFKIVVVLITAFIILLGFYKILLSFLLLVNKNHQKFNLISTIFSVIGLIGLIASYLHFGFNYTIDISEMFSQSLSFTFGFFLAIILFNGFVLFPKSITKFKD